MLLHRIIFVLISLSITLAGGCASTGEKAVESFETTKVTVNEAESQVDLTIRAMLRLRTAPAESIKDAFAQYKEDVVLLDEQGKKAKDRAQEMKEEADAHVKAWQTEMETIQDPQIKSTMESRRLAVKSNFQAVQMYADDARKAYEPFLKGNQQLVQAFSIDLSPAAVASLAPSIDKTLADGQMLKQRIEALQRALANIANGVSPLGAPL
jgi:Protein of unknown function (DUF2959)